MPTSALESTVHPAALDAFEISVAPESPNRRIAWASALSVGLHLVLLVGVGLLGVAFLVAVTVLRSEAAERAAQRLPEPAYENA